MSDTGGTHEHNWFWRLNRRVLRSYATQVSLADLRERYPGMSRREIATRRVNQAARRGGLVGLATGAAISMAEAGFVLSALGSLASLFAASPVTVPAMALSLPVALLAFVVEISLILRIQLHLAYELFLLYGVPGDVEDPEQMQDIVRLAFGIKGAEIAGQAFQKLMPQVADEVVRRAIRSPVVTRPLERWVERRLTWQFARKYLGEGGLVRILVPGMAVFTAAAWDFLSTRAIGRSLHTRMERRDMAAEEARRLDLAPITDAARLLRAALGLALTDRNPGENGLCFYRALADRLQEERPDAPDMAGLGGAGAFAWERVLAELGGVKDRAEGRAMYATLSGIAAVEGRISRRKRKRLAQAAQALGLTPDPVRLQALAAPYRETPGGRACLYMVLALFMLLAYTCVVCGLGAWLLPQVPAMWEQFL